MNVIVPVKPEGINFISEVMFNLAVEEWKAEIQQLKMSNLDGQTLSDGTG